MSYRGSRIKTKAFSDLMYAEQCDLVLDKIAPTGAFCDTIDLTKFICGVRAPCRWVAKSRKGVNDYLHRK